MKEELVKFLREMSGKIPYESRTIKGSTQRVEAAEKLLADLENYDVVSKRDDVVEKLVNELQSWESLFYPIDGMGLTSIDYTLEPEVKKHIISTRKLLQEVRRG